MTSVEVISKVSKSAEVNQNVVRSVLEAYSNLVLDSYTEVVPLLNIGKFKPKHRKAATYRNPQNGDSVDVPAKTVMQFVINPSAKKSTTIEE